MEHAAEDDHVTRVMLVDDHEVVRTGLRSLLAAQDDLDVVAEASTAAEAVLRARSYHPDVVVLDVRLPDRSGVEACRDIRAEHPEIAVLMLTSFSDDQALFDSIMAGAAGYLLKQIRGMDLVDGIRRVARGESLLDPAVTARVLDRLRHPGTHGDARLSRLTPTELRIVEMIADGMTNRAIGDEIGLAEKTVKNYVSSILAKMHMSRRTEAAAYLADRRARSESQFTD
ncbi:MAG TPA: response regulator transcription factor [Euzebyales bacterium]|nr:response regulator transcription factor [Euzebyales bacterium]